jgi:hypothetical protein
MRRGLPRRLRGAGGGKAVCFHPVIEGISATRQRALMGLCPKPRSLSNRGEWLQGKRPLPGARFPSWEPIAPSGLLGLLSSRALSVPAVSRTGNNGCEDARGIGDSVKYSTFAQFNSLHFCSARYRFLLGAFFGDSVRIFSCIREPGCGRRPNGFQVLSMSGFGRILRDRKWGQRGRGQS